jgi:hypothetical protein
MGSTMKPRLNPPCSSDGTGYDLPDAPNRLRMTPSAIKAMPKVSSKPYTGST